ncbi:hypothetical protein BGZ60DRAFT_418708 [Tricladium varicosporioides]|nr:hypothetical protein BGZ60DRAFT_418708 [Hymenoscyphus varicosporioides]
MGPVFFQTLGYITAAACSLNILSAIYNHFLTPSRLYNYLRTTPSGKSWAIITGSTSGLGYGLATQLASRGFNIIIHGRNANKLNSLRQDLLSKYPRLRCEVLLLDATSCFSKDEYERSKKYIIEVTHDKPITLLINNIGVGHDITHDFRPMTEHTGTDIDILINTNVGFLTHLTHLLLPTMKAAAPGLIINIGSLASISMPYLSVYSATKAYINTFSLALDSELRQEGTDIKVESMVFGDIDTPVHRMDPSFAVLSEEGAAESVLKKAGTIAGIGGAGVGCPYWGHAFLGWVCEVQPWWMLRAGMGMALKEKRGESLERRKKL